MPSDPDEFDTWRTRRLDDVELDYLFLDGSHFKMRAGHPRRTVLAARGISKPVLVGLDAAANESNDAWDDFLDGAGGHRCWSSPTAPPAWSGRSNASCPAHYASGA